MKLNLKKIFSVSLMLVLILFLNSRVNSEDINAGNMQLSQETAQVNATSETNDNSSILEESIPAENSYIGNSSPSENNTLVIETLNKTGNASIIQNLVQEKLENKTFNLSVNENISGANLASYENNASENSNASSNKTEDYIPLENLASQDNENSNSPNSGSISIENTALNNSTGNEDENLSIKMINLTLSKDGKKEIVGEIPENFDINSIVKEEKIINENWTKQVTIKSKDHLESSLRIYSDVPKISADEKDKITIFWINENKKLEFDDFYDTDEDGLIDRVSWTVPHLSDQTFEISIDFQIDNYSSEISLNIISAPNGTAANPINFKFNISYEHPENLNCTLFVGDYLYLLNIFNESNFFYNLPNGDYNWSLKCGDGNQTKETEISNFIINESFLMNLNEKVYLLGEPVIIRLDSNKDINATVSIYPLDGLDNRTFHVYNNSNNHILSLASENFPKEGLYEIETIYNTLAEPFVLKANLSVLNAQINLNKENAKIGEDIKIYANISSSIEKITSIILDFGDGTSNVTYFNINENKKSIEFTHRYNQENNYTIKLNAIIGGRNFEIQKNRINISKNLPIDAERPVISLIYPDDSDILKNSSINFSYSANDSIKLANCTFELYNNTGIWGILSYSKTEINPNNGTKNISVSGLNEGDYSWRVECYDNSSNSQYISRSFRISFQSSQNSSPVAGISSASAGIIKNNNNYNNYSSQRINSLIPSLKSFLTKQDSYNPDQKEAMEDLGISKDLDYYNKRLIQIEQDLSNNVNYIKDNSARETRVQELLDEIENISQKIPRDIEVIDKSEFVKNSISNDLVNILSNYLKSQNITLNNMQIKDLAEKNYNLQSYLSVSTKVKQVRIKYNGSEKEITLITKKIDLKNSSFDKILEIIPKEIYENPENIVFINKEKPSGDSIFKISPEDLIDNKLVYYIEGFIDLKKIEKTDTLIYNEFPIKNTGITGFFLLDLNSSIKNSLFYTIIICIMLGFLVFFIISKKVKIALWKKDEKVIKIFSLIKEAKRNINAKDFVCAKEKYNEIKEIYPAMPSGCKKYIYKNIESIRSDIDRKDISSMIKEYDEAKKQNRENDAQMIYENIKRVYKKLPKKYQQAVYEKLLKNLPGQNNALITS